MMECDRSRPEGEIPHKATWSQMGVLVLVCYPRLFLIARNCSPRTGSVGRVPRAGVVPEALECHVLPRTQPQRSAKEPNLGAGSPSPSGSLTMLSILPEPTCPRKNTHPYAMSPNYMQTSGARTRAVPGSAKHAALYSAGSCSDPSELSGDH